MIEPKRHPAGMWISLSCLIFLLFLATIVGTAWSVRRVFMTGDESDVIMTAAQKTAVIAIAEFPASLKAVIFKTNPLVAPKPKDASWVHRFPSQEDRGYLLFSGLYKNDATSSVKLIRISDGRIMTSWFPDWKYVLSKTTEKKFDIPVTLANIAAANPLLLDDGDIVFATNRSSVRLPACDTRPRWVLDETMHHSTVLDSDGASYWSPSVEPVGFVGNPYLQNQIRNDAIARISLDGKLLYRRGIAEIFHDNDLDFLLFNGNGTLDINKDPIHLNQIREAPSDTKYWKKGDLLISLRNPNTVLLYRLSENKVIWRQTGPWTHQHSVDFVNDHQISVFNNNSILQLPAKANSSNFLTPASINEVMIYDFDTNKITQPYKSLLEATHPRTVTAGRARVLPDGGLFLEETDNSRILRFSKDKLLWSFINDYDNQHVGALAWSSYLTADEARKPLEALKAKGCLSDGPAATPFTGS